MQGQAGRRRVATDPDNKADRMQLEDFSLTLCKDARNRRMKASAGLAAPDGSKM
jgi:hypothetical protein